MKVTKDNIALVAHRLKVLSNGFIEQTFYPPAKKVNAVCKKLGITDGCITRIEQSAISHFDTVIITLETNFCGFPPFIRIHNNIQDDRYYMAMIIEVGDEITFNKGLIIIKDTNIIIDEKCICKIKY